MGKHTNINKIVGLAKKNIDFLHSTPWKDKVAYVYKNDEKRIWLNSNQ